LLDPPSPNVPGRILAVPKGRSPTTIGLATGAGSLGNRIHRGSSTLLFHDRLSPLRPLLRLRAGPPCRACGPGWRPALGRSLPPSDRSLTAIRVKRGNLKAIGRRSAKRSKRAYRDDRTPAVSLTVSKGWNADRGHAGECCAAECETIRLSAAEALCLNRAREFERRARAADPCPRHSVDRMRPRWSA
jgi:hypothetical protein